MKKFAILIFSFLFLTSCTSYYCDPTTAYNAGLKDGKANGYMQVYYSKQCPINMRATIDNAYTQGYMKALGVKKLPPR